MNFEQTFHILKDWDYSVNSIWEIFLSYLINIKVMEEKSAFVAKIRAFYGPSMYECIFRSFVVYVIMLY